MAETAPEKARFDSSDSGAKRHKKSYSGMSFENSLLTVYAKNLRDDFGGDTESQLPVEEALQFLKDIAADVKEVVVYGKEGDIESHYGKIKRDYRAALMTSVDDTVDEYLMYELEDSPLSKLTLRHVSFLNPVSISGLIGKCRKRNIELVVKNIQITTDPTIFLKEMPDEYGDEGYILEITGEETLVAAVEDLRKGKSGDEGDVNSALIVELAKKCAPEVSSHKQDELKQQLTKLAKEEEMAEHLQIFVHAVFKQYAPNLVKDGETVIIESMDLSKLDTLPLRLIWWWVSTRVQPDEEALDQNDKDKEADGFEVAQAAADPPDSNNISVVHRAKK